MFFKSFGTTRKNIIEQKKVIKYVLLQWLRNGFWIGEASTTGNKK